MGLTIFKQFFHDISLIVISSSSKFQRPVKDKKKERRWWLFHATDFQTLMYPCFTFCRILGIFPYKINASSFKSSKLYYILSTIVTCVFCFYALIILYELNISGRLQLKGLRKTIEINLFYMFSCFIMVVTYVLSGPRMRLLQTILEISLRLPSKSYQKLSMLIHAKDIFGIFLLLGQLICYYNLNFPILLNMVNIFALYNTLLVFQMDMLYMNCVCVLKACFKQINDNLANLLVMNNKPHLFKRIYHEQKDPLLLMELKILKKQELMVSGTVQMLNMIFSLQLLATTIITFVRITFWLYFCLRLWQDYIDINDSEKRFSYIFLITSVVYYFIKITLIVWACETGKNQAMEISITIHDMINSTDNEQIKNELQLFSLQIQHTRQNTFSAKGLTMDATLLAAIMGNITTYLLILIQFMSNSCDEKFAVDTT